MGENKWIAQSGYILLVKMKKMRMKINRLMNFNKYKRIAIIMHYHMYLKQGGKRGGFKEYLKSTMPIFLMLFPYYVFIYKGIQWHVKQAAKTLIKDKD